jgi:hypothetical protein
MIYEPKPEIVELSQMNERVVQQATDFRKDTLCGVTVLVDVK